MQPYAVARHLIVFAIASFSLPGCGSGPSPVTPTQQAVPAQPQLQPIPQGTFTVSGTVSSAGSGQLVPLEGVHVEDSQRHVFVRTGDDGSYAIRDVGAGDAYIYFMKDGYRSLAQRFTLTADTRLDVQLVRE